MYITTYLAQARFEVDAQEGRLTLDRVSVAVEAVCTAGQGGDNPGTVTGGKVQSKEFDTPDNDKASLDVPDSTASPCGTEEEGTPKDNQGDEVNKEKTMTEEEEAVVKAAVNNKAAATEERRPCENFPLNTTEETSKIGTHGNHLNGGADKLVCSADTSQPSPLSSNGSVLSFTTCKLPS